MLLSRDNSARKKSQHITDNDEDEDDSDRERERRLAKNLLFDANSPLLQ
jgi:hypothetical protein